MSSYTHSEQVFASICRRHNYEVTELPTRPQQKTADFSVVTPDCRFIAEVEELTPNADDHRQIRELKEQHWTHGGGKVGARARKAIRDASRQLREHTPESVPLIIVLYNNIRTSDGRMGYPMDHLELFHIDAAMYGNLVVHVSLGNRTSRTPDRSGGGRTTTTQEKTYISAVAVMSDWDDETILVYHNSFATHPLPRSVFSDSKSFHLRKPTQVFDTPMKWEAWPIAQASS